MANSERIEAIIAMLAERFPNCFTSGGSPRPLKIGIHEDLMAAGLEFSKTELRRAIGHYCSLDAYRQALVAGGDRVDLDGNPSGSVVEAEIEAARRADWRKPRKVMKNAS